MSAVIPFAQQSVPAHIASAFGGKSNIEPAVSVPSLTFRGKVWRINLKGEETPIMANDEPLQTVRVIVLACSPRRLRSYYEGKYVEGERRQPTCYSNDGTVPDPDIDDPQSESCDTCKQNVKGSAVSASGKPVTACQTFKRLVVIPESDFNFEPLVMRIPQTSLWDAEAKELEAKGWYAWDQYLALLRGRGVTHTASLVTKMRFDPRVAYPKVIFSHDRWLEPEEMAEISEVVHSAQVSDLLHGKFEKAQAVEGAKKEPPKVAKKEADPLADLIDEPAPPKAAKKGPPKEVDPLDDEPAPPKVTKKEADPLDDLFSDEPAPPKAAKKEPPKAAKKEPPKAAKEEVEAEEKSGNNEDDALAELLSGWE